MKIAVLIWDFSGGGAERVAVSLANAFSAKGHDVKVVVGQNVGPNRLHLNSEIPVIVPKSSSSLDVCKVLWQTLYEFRPDVLLSHQTTRNVLAIFSHIVSPGRGKRLIIGVEHGEMNHTSNQTRGIRLKVYFFLARLLYPFASGIVAVSENVRQSVEEYLWPIPLKVVVLPNPVLYPGFEDRASFAPTHPFLVDKRTPVFVAVGRLETQKNYSLLLRAFSIVRSQINARLIIFGVGRLEDLLRQESVALDISSDVDFAGYIENPLPEIRAADALVISSIWEGLPTVAIEALSCGTQVVSTNNSEGIRTILANGLLGRISKSDEPCDLAKIMSETIFKPISSITLKNGVNNYRSNVVADIYIEFFNMLKHV